MQRIPKFNASLEAYTLVWLGSATSATSEVEGCGGIPVESLLLLPNAAAGSEDASSSQVLAPHANANANLLVSALLPLPELMLLLVCFGSWHPVEVAKSASAKSDSGSTGSTGSIDGSSKKKSSVSSSPQIFPPGWQIPFIPRCLAYLDSLLVYCVAAREEELRVGEGEAAVGAVPPGTDTGSEEVDSIGGVDSQKKREDESSSGDEGMALSSPREIGSKDTKDGDANDSVNDDGDGDGTAAVNSHPTPQPEATDDRSRILSNDAVPDSRSTVRARRVETPCSIVLASLREVLSILFCSHGLEVMTARSGNTSSSESRHRVGHPCSAAIRDIVTSNRTVLLATRQFATHILREASRMLQLQLGGSKSKTGMAMEIQLWNEFKRLSKSIASSLDGHSSSKVD
jgi:hypothetical protein